MCILLLLVVNAASFARALPISQGYPQDFLVQPFQYEVLVPYPLSGVVVEVPARTNKPIHGGVGLDGQSHELRDKHVPKLRTNGHSGRDKQRDHGVKVNKNHDGTTPESFPDSGNRRNYEKTRQGGRNTNVPNLTGRAREEGEAEWVWGSDDAVETRGRSSLDELDDLDDRTAINGSNCPTGKIKVEGKCVETY